jgi:hypothetical protein
VVLVSAIGTGTIDPGSATAGAVTSATATTRSGRAIAKRSANHPPIDAPTRAARSSPSASRTEPTNAVWCAARSTSV